MFQAVQDIHLSVSVSVCVWLSDWWMLMVVAELPVVFIDPCAVGQIAARIHGE